MIGKYVNSSVTFYNYCYCYYNNYYYYYYYTRLTASSGTTWVSRYLKGKTSLDLNGTRDNWHAYR